MACHLKPALAFALAALATGSGHAWAAGSEAQPARTAGTSRPEIIRPDADDNLQWAASVVQINELRNQGDLSAKLFGTAGGDPAMNGLYTYLAFFASPGDGWRVFRLGDFLSYRVLSEAPGRVAVEVGESVMDEGTGNIGSRTRRLLVSWTAAGGEPPASISVRTPR